MLRFLIAVSALRESGVFLEGAIPPDGQWSGTGVSPIMFGVEDVWGEE